MKLGIYCVIYAFSLQVGLLVSASSPEECADNAQKESLLHPLQQVERRSNLEDRQHPFVYSAFTDSTELSKRVSELDVGNTGKSFESNSTNIFRYWSGDEHLNDVFPPLTTGWKLVRGNTLERSRMNCPPQSHGRYSLFLILEPKVPEFLRSLMKDKLGLEPTHLTLFGGCNRTSTGLHFDQDGNNFLQLRGRKRFYLYPPSHILSIPFFPKGHPHHRQTSLVPLDLHSLSEETATDFRGIDAGHSKLPEAFGRGFTTELKAGEILYVPPFWTHYVESMSDDSLGVPLREAEFKNEAYTALWPPLPVNQRAQYTKGKIHKGLSVFLDSVLASQSDLKTVFRTRWRFVMQRAREKTLERFAELKADPKVKAEDLDTREYVFFFGYAGRTLKQFAGLNVKEESVRKLLIIEFCEDVVYNLISDKEEAAAFLLSYLNAL